MKNTGRLKWIALIIIMAVAIIFYYEEIKVEEVKIPKTQVVIAKDYIPENTVITKDMVAMDSRYTDDLLKVKDNVTSNFEKVVGKRTRVPLYKNETVKLSRLLDNEPYMKDNYEDKKLITFTISGSDKSLDIKEGDYIDVWLEPNKDGLILGEQSRILFEKQQVVSVDNAAHQNINLNKSKKNINEIKENKDKVPSDITLELTNEDIKKLYDIDEMIFYFRVSLYGQDKFYKVVGDVIEREKVKPIQENINTENVQETNNNSTN